MIPFLHGMCNFSQVREAKLVGKGKALSLAATVTAGTLSAVHEIKNQWLHLRLSPQSGAPQAPQPVLTHRRSLARSKV